MTELGVSPNTESCFSCDKNRKIVLVYDGPRYSPGVLFLWKIKLPAPQAVYNCKPPNMKQTLLLIFLAFAAHSGFAQDSVKTRVKERHNADLKLNEKQTKAVQDINKTYMENVQDIRRNKSLSQADRKTKMDALQTERSSRLKEVLDAEQYAQWQQNRERMTARADRYQHRSARKGKSPRELPAKELGLSDSQHEELKAINKEFMTKAMALKGLDKEVKRTKIKALKDERKQQIKTALGDETFRKYEAWEKERAKSRRDGMKERRRKTPAPANNL